MNWALADFWVTDYAQIEKWWEIVMSAYLMVSLHSEVLIPTPDNSINSSADPILTKFREHEWWDFGKGWENLLNNLRLIVQPFILFNLIKPWLRVFPISPLSAGFSTLIALMNQMRGAILGISSSEAFLFSSA